MSKIFLCCVADSQWRMISCWMFLLLVILAESMLESSINFHGILIVSLKSPDSQPRENNVRWLSRIYQLCHATLGLVTHPTSWTLKDGCHSKHTVWVCGLTFIGFWYRINPFLCCVEKFWGMKIFENCVWMKLLSVMAGARSLLDDRCLVSNHAIVSLQTWDAHYVNINDNLPTPLLVLSPTMPSATSNSNAAMK